MAWDGQLYDGSADPDRPVDLYRPVPGHQSAHGAFDARARASSWETQLTIQASRVSTAVSNAVAYLSFRAQRGISLRQRPPVQSATGSLLVPPRGDREPTNVTG